MDVFPADLLLLFSSNEDAMAYIQTGAMDGDSGQGLPIGERKHGNTKMVRYCTWGIFDLRKTKCV